MSAAADRDDDALAGEYVLGVLSEAERAAVEARLPREPELAAAIARWSTWFAEIDDAAPVETPSPELWTRIVAEVGAARPLAAPRKPAGQSWWNNLPLWRGLGLAGAIASIALAVALNVYVERAARQATVIAVLLSPDLKPGAIVEAFGNDRVRVVPLVDIHVPGDRALELWTLPDPAKGPVSLGLLPGPRSSSLPVANIPLPRADQLYEITLEPATGSPIGRPTGPVLFKGLATPPR